LRPGSVFLLVADGAFFGAHIVLRLDVAVRVRRRAGRERLRAPNHREFVKVERPVPGEQGWLRLLSRFEAADTEAAGNQHKADRDYSSQKPHILLGLFQENAARAEAAMLAVEDTSFPLRRTSAT